MQVKAVLGMNIVSTITAGIAIIIHIIDIILLITAYSYRYYDQSYITEDMLLVCTFHFSDIIIKK